MKFSVVIATYNRAVDLARTLDSLAGLRPEAGGQGPEAGTGWEVIVVDNNSTDDTRGVVDRAARTFPAPLRYVFEREQGRSPALNAGIRGSRGAIIVTTDDDVRVEPDWLDRAAGALESLGCDYVGGRVLPIWSGPRPAWLADRPGRHWAVIALLDYGPAPIEFGARVPLGVNMAFRRQAFDRAGLWDARIGRRAGTLLGQEVREWCIRARRAGVRGCYAPDMVVRHVIPTSRLRKAYFRRWFYWRGVSRALLYAQAGLDMETPEQTTLDFTRVPHVAGMPRYLFRKLAREAWAWLRETLRGDWVAAFEHEIWICFFAGIAVQRWRDRRLAIPAAQDGSVRLKPDSTDATGSSRGSVLAAGVE
jgi:glycosyltransferase involved in cell wall biosynthesis